NPPTNAADVSFSNSSSLGVQLTFHENEGPPQTLILPAGGTADVNNVPNCACFTVDDFTPQRGTLTNGYSFEVCSPAEVTLANTSGPFVGVQTSISGAGPSTPFVTLKLENHTTNVFRLFPSINNVPSTQLTLGPTDQTTFTVNLCQRLQLLVRDPNNTIPDMGLVVSPSVPPGSIYAIVNLGGGNFAIQKQPS